MSDKPKVTAACATCPKTVDVREKKAGGAVTPKRWKNTPAGLLCPDCVASQFVRRSVRVRLIGVHESEERDGKELYRALNAAAEQCGAFANWYSQRLWQADPANAWRHGGEEKFPAMPQVDCYASATKAFPSVAPTALCQLAQTVRAYYCADRFSVAAKQESSVRSYRRFDLPIPVHGQSWDLVRLDDDSIFLRFQIGPGKRWACKVYADHDNLLRIKQLVAGEAESGTLSLMKRRRRNVPGESGKAAPKSWFVRISGLFPRVERRPKLAQAEMRLSHASDALWFGEIVGARLDAEPLVYHGETLRERIEWHRRRDERLQVDNSVTRRHVSRRTAKRRAAKRSGYCAKHAARVTTEINLACSVVVGWCLSKGVNSVNYTGGKWLESFPYHRLIETLKTRLENHGIILAVSATVPSYDGVTAALAEPTCETGDA